MLIVPGLPANAVNTTSTPQLHRAREPHNIVEVRTNSGEVSITPV
jgi:hypothetical protein